MLKSKEILLSNVDKLHTTRMGVDRIKKNILLETDDVVGYCKDKILDPSCKVYKNGKNFYCEVENIRLTINSSSYTLITAHIKS